jgi:hypothetical protein
MRLTSPCLERKPSRVGGSPLCDVVSSFLCHTHADGKDRLLEWPDRSCLLFMLARASTKTFVSRGITVLSYGSHFSVIKSLKFNTCPIFRHFPLGKGPFVWFVFQIVFAIDECLLLEATLTCFQPSKVNSLINMKCGEKSKLHQGFIISLFHFLDFSGTATHFDTQGK